MLSRRRRAVGVHAGRRLPAVADRVHDPVVEHVPDRLRRLARGKKRVRVVGEYRPLAVHDLVQRPRHPHREPLHGAPQRHRIRRLHHQVEVVPLHREVHQAEAEPLAPALERPPQRPEAPVRPQIPDFAPDADRDVQRTFAELGADAMRDVLPFRLPLPSSAPPSSTPPRERQLLLRILLHDGSVPRESDIPPLTLLRCAPGRGCPPNQVGPASRSETRMMGLPARGPWPKVDWADISPAFVTRVADWSGRTGPRHPKSAPADHVRPDRHNPQSAPIRRAPTFLLLSTPRFPVVAPEEFG